MKTTPLDLSLYTKNTTGSKNIELGIALYENTSGTDIAIGNGALDAADTESGNLAIGYDALGGPVAGGESNLAVGNYALDALTAGDDNIGIGMSALTTVTSGNRNIAIGKEALKAQTTSHNNVAIGRWAGDAITSGGDNVVIGNNADLNSATGTNQIVIGSGAVGTANNTVQLGNTSITNVKTSGTITAGAVTYPKTDGSANQVLKTDGSGTLGWTSVSATPSGAIMMFAAGSAPSGWLICDGSAVSRATC